MHSRHLDPKDRESQSIARMGGQCGSYKMLPQNHLPHILRSAFFHERLPKDSQNGGCIFDVQPSYVFLQAPPSAGSSALPPTTGQSVVYHPSAQGLSVQQNPAFSVFGQDTRASDLLGGPSLHPTGSVPLPSVTGRQNTNRPIPRIFV